MAKTGYMPTRSQVAHHATALALLASFAACSHGSESRPRPADEARQQPAPAVSAVPAPRSQISDRAKQGVIRSAEPVPAPDAIAVSADASTGSGSSAVTASAARGNVGDPSDSLPHPAVEEVLSPAYPLRLVPPERPRAAAPMQSTPVETQPAASWPLFAGAGAACASLLALALLRRRDRKAAQKQRDADDLRTQELVRTELQRAREQEQEVAEEQARAAEEEHARAAAAQAAAAALAADQRERQLQADLSTIREHANKKVDPRIEAAHQLFDLLHHAERDVEPFLRLLDAAVPNDASSAEARGTVAAWHEAMLGTRNRLSEALARHNAPVDLRPVEPAADLQSAVSRLIDHAARMNALMMAQQQQNSAILHWSRQLPGALVQLFWRAQTAKYSSTMTQLPRVPDAPAPSAVAGPAVSPTPIAAQAVRPARTQDKAIQQALRGVQRHAARA